MNKKFMTLLATGCIIICSSVGVQAADLKDSMLKPSASSEKSDQEKEAKEASVFTVEKGTVTMAADLVALSEGDRVQKIGEMCQQDYERTGVLASVSAAQCILESGYLTTELATEANNCFGMKATLSGNTWEQSTWDGESMYTKQTGEEYNGRNVTIVADFRRYDSVEESVGDHSAYLLGATVDGNALRYEGLKGETDYREAIQIIKDGGYATDSAYVDKICSIIERFDLTRFDELSEKSMKKDVKAQSAKKSVKKKAKEPAKSNSTLTYEDNLYRIRKTWEDTQGQLGAFISQKNAEAACKKGYSVFDSKGTVVYTK